jgi:hypothetical protein
MLLHILEGLEAPTYATSRAPTMYCWKLATRTSACDRWAYLKDPSEKILDERHESDYVYVCAGNST